MSSTVAGQGLVKVDDLEMRAMLFEMDANTANSMGVKANLPDTPRHGHDIFAFVDCRARRFPRTSESVKWGAGYVHKYSFQFTSIPSRDSSRQILLRTIQRMNNQLQS